MNKRQVLQITKALVDSRRFDILERIAATKDEISCIDLRAEIPISRATLSHHIKELATAGLIERRRQSKYIYLRMRKKNWREYLKRLRTLAPHATPHNPHNLPSTPAHPQPPAPH